MCMLINVTPTNVNKYVFKTFVVKRQPLVFMIETIRSSEVVSGWHPSHPLSLYRQAEKPQDFMVSFLKTRCSKSLRFGPHGATTL